MTLPEAPGEPLILCLHLWTLPGTRILDLSNFVSPTDLWKQDYQAPLGSLWQGSVRTEWWSPCWWWGEIPDKHKPVSCWCLGNMFHLDSCITNIKTATFNVRAFMETSIACGHVGVCVFWKNTWHGCSTVVILFFLFSDKKGHAITYK